MRQVTLKQYKKTIANLAPLTPLRGEGLGVRDCPIVSKKACYGFTLIEMVLVLSLVTVLLGGTLQLFAAVRQTDQRSQDNLVFRQTVRRFVDDIRRDTREADELRIEEKQMVVSSELSGAKRLTENPSPPAPLAEAEQGELEFRASSRIVYEILSDATVQRSVVNGGKTKAREDYRFGDATEIELQPMDELRGVRWLIRQRDREGDPIEVIALRGGDR